MIIFLFPPTRQFKGTFFFYFLILAIEDPLGVFVIKNFGIYQGVVHSCFSIFLLISILKPEDFLKSLRLLIPIVAVVYILMVYLFSQWGWDFKGIRLGIGLAHIIIFIALAKSTVIFIKAKLSINLFHIMLLLYEASVITKFIVYSLYSSKGFFFFYLTLAFELLLGLFFTFFKDDNPKLIIKA